MKTIFDASFNEFLNPICDILDVFRDPLAEFVINYYDLDIAGFIHTLILLFMIIITILIFIIPSWRFVAYFCLKKVNEIIINYICLTLLQTPLVHHSFSYYRGSLLTHIIINPLIYGLHIIVQMLRLIKIFCKQSCHRNTIFDPI